MADSVQALGIHAYVGRVAGSGEMEDGGTGLAYQELLEKGSNGIGRLTKYSSQNRQAPGTMRSWCTIGGKAPREPLRDSIHL